MATNTAMELTADGAGSPRSDEFFIAGIGAGGGGMEALTAFFGQVKPGTGFAYVVMPQDPGRSVTELCAGIAQLPVLEITKAVHIRPDHIYILSSAHALQMHDGRIVIGANSHADAPSDPIDAFFCSLAESCGQRAAGVVLSGNSLAGTSGLKRVKELGGALFVQDPREAVYPAMPRRAIASGLSDGAFPAAAIPARLAAHAQMQQANVLHGDRAWKPRLNMVALHHQLLEQYAPPSVLIDAAYDVLHLSRQAGRYLPIAGNPSRNLFDMVHPELRGDLQNACNQAKQRHINVEVRDLKLDVGGLTESVTVHVRPVRNEDGSASTTPGFMLILFERTDGLVSTSRAEMIREELTNERNRARQLAADLQALVDASPACIALFKVVHGANEQNRIDDFVLAVGNRKLSEYVGLPPDQLPGRPAAEFGDLLWGADTMQILREAYAAGQARYDEKAVIRDGEPHWMGVSVSRYADGMVLTGLDITALKLAQDQQQFWLRELEKSSESAQALATLRMAFQERGELLRAASHDLRGQVGVLASATYLLGMAGTEANSSVLIQMIRRNIQQMTHLMTSLLDYSRLQAGQEAIQVSRFNVGEVLQEVIDSLEPYASERGLWLRSSGPDSLEVESDPVQIRRIVQNLLLNALKYTKTGGATVSWQLLGKMPGWQLNVSDTGPGLSAHQLIRLRGEPQAGIALEANASGRAGSEGIGLSIVKQLCKMLGGQLIVESETGIGTVFTIRFDGSSGPDMS